MYFSCSFCRLGQKSRCKLRFHSLDEHFVDVPLKIHYLSIGLEATLRPGFQLLCHLPLELCSLLHQLLHALLGWPPQEVSYISWFSCLLLIEREILIVSRLLFLRHCNYLICRIDFQRELGSHFFTMNSIDFMFFGLALWFFRIGKLVGFA